MVYSKNPATKELAPHRYKREAAKGLFAWVKRAAQRYAENDPDLRRVPWSTQGWRVNAHFDTT